MFQKRLEEASLSKCKFQRAFKIDRFRTIEAFVGEEARLNVIYGYESFLKFLLFHLKFSCLTNLFDGMEHEGRALVLKKVLMHFLRKFPTDFENADTADDYIRKTLHLWRLFVS